MLPGCCPGEPSGAGRAWRTWGGGARVRCGAGVGWAGTGWAGGTARLPASTGSRGRAQRCSVLPGVEGCGGLCAGGGLQPGCPGSLNSNQTRRGGSRPAGGSAPGRRGAGGRRSPQPPPAAGPLGEPGRAGGGAGGCSAVPPACRVPEALSGGSG